MKRVNKTVKMYRLSARLIEVFAPP